MLGRSTPDRAYGTDSSTMIGGSRVTSRAGMEQAPTEDQRELGLLSVVTPMHDEQDNARLLYERVAAALEGMNWELVVVDDGSRDATGTVLAEVAAADERVKVLGLSRNFGHQPALTAGLEHARGDAVVMMD